MHLGKKFEGTMNNLVSTLAILHRQQLSSKYSRVITLPVVDVIKLFGGNLENLDFPLCQNSKNRPF